MRRFLPFIAFVALGVAAFMFNFFKKHWLKLVLLAVGYAALLWYYWYLRHAL